MPFLSPYILKSRGVVGYAQFATALISFSIYRISLKNVPPRRVFPFLKSTYMVGVQFYHIAMHVRVILKIS